MNFGIDQVGSLDPTMNRLALTRDDSDEIRDADPDISATDFALPQGNVAAAAVLAGLVATPQQRPRSAPLFTRGALAAANMLTALGRSVRMAISTTETPVVLSAGDEPESEAPKPGSSGGSRMDWLEAQAVAFLATFGWHATTRQRPTADATREPQRSSAGARAKGPPDRRRVAPALASMEPVRKVARPAAVHRKSPARGWRTRRTLAWCSSVAGAGLLASLVWVYVLPPSSASSDDDSAHATAGCDPVRKPSCRR